MNYEAVIGLEVHAQLQTNTKIFCGCETAFGEEANTRTWPSPRSDRKADTFPLEQVGSSGLGLIP